MRCAALLLSLFACSALSSEVDATSTAPTELTTIPVADCDGETLKYCRYLVAICARRYAMRERLCRHSFEKCNEIDKCTQDCSPHRLRFCSKKSNFTMANSLAMDGMSNKINEWCTGVENCHKVDVTSMAPTELTTIPVSVNATPTTLTEHTTIPISDCSPETVAFCSRRKTETKEPAYLMDPKRYEYDLLCKNADNCSQATPTPSMERTNLTAQDCTTNRLKLCTDFKSACDISRNKSALECRNLNLYCSRIDECPKATPATPTEPTPICTFVKRDQYCSYSKNPCASSLYSPSRCSRYYSKCFHKGPCPHSRESPKRGGSGGG